MQTLRKIIEIDEEKCDGCGQCVPACAEGAIEVINGKAKVIADVLCDGLGACIGECPNDALHIIERQAEEFDETAVEAHLATKAKNAETSMPCGCPSAEIKSFAPADVCRSANEPAELRDTESALTHWPVQIRLVPPTAPFLKNADLLVLADCAAVAYAALHQDYIRDKVVMMGCPKFDDTELYIDKFTQIFSTAHINSVTILYMEVPCCGGLPMIVKKGMAAAGKTTPLTETIISCKGKPMST